MHDFSKISPVRTVTVDWILSKIDEASIWAYYFGRFEIGKVYAAKHRKDSKPSVGFYINKSGKIILNDFATGEKLNCFAYVQRLFNLDFSATLSLIAADFGLIDRKTLKVHKSVLDFTSTIDKDAKKNTAIQFIPYKKWHDKQLAYWRMYEISQEELEKERVFPVKKLFINKKEIKSIDLLTFAYVEPEIGIKIYSPFSTWMKHLTNIPLDKPFGIADLPYKSDTVIIGKAKKDMLILKKLFTDVIATQNESEAALSEETQELLLNRYEKRIIIFDNDPTGVEVSSRFNSLGFDYFNIPKEYYEKRGIKDVADLVEWYGLEALKDLLLKKNICPNNL